MIRAGAIEMIKSTGTSDLLALIFSLIDFSSSEESDFSDFSDFSCKLFV